MGSADLTVIILTFNETLNLERTLKSVQSVGADIVIVDSFSTDDTLAIAERYNAKIYQNKWVNYAMQFQWALDHAEINSDWVMRLDADEFFDDEMKKMLIPTLQQSPKNVNGYRCKLWNYYLGQPIRYGGYDPLLLLRVWRHGAGRIEQRWMDEHLVLAPGEKRLLEGKLLHDNRNNHTWWVNKHNNYANREMIEIMLNKYKLKEKENIKGVDNLSAKSKRWIKENIYAHLPLFVRPTLYFVLRYFICLGFLDGKIGFAYHYFQAYWYRSLVDVRILEVELKMRGKPYSRQLLLNSIHEVSGIDLKI